ncbi:MAG: ATP-dependent DNA helicase [Acholeplasmataceae bacterium]
MIRIPVRDIVSFLYASGDLTSETFQNVSALEGMKAHQYIQSLYTSSDQKEVSISYPYTSGDITYLLSGRIDGLLQTTTGVCLDEIKSSRKNIFDENFTYNGEHLAQLKFYAYMYLKTEHLTEIEGQIKYIQIADYQTRVFHFTFYLRDLEVFILESIQMYQEWLDILFAHQKERTTSIETLVFPFPSYRRGQKQMMAAVYQTVKDKDILYTIAPTGIGKTMAALFPALKALENERQKIFYATAKTQGKAIALDALRLLKENGLRIKALEITAKDTICFLDQRNCDPQVCPFAKGFFDRLKDATIDIFVNEDLFDRSTIEKYAKKHMVCPFEYSLYISYFVDIIICDYNYIFDPRVHLVRYFDEINYEPILLVDEAHNLVSRSREMYSATFAKSDLISLRKLTKNLKPSLRGPIKKALDIITSFEERLEQQPFLTNKTLDASIPEVIENLLRKIENTLKENQNPDHKSKIMDLYFQFLAFMRIYEYYGPTYLTNIYRLKDEDIVFEIRCLDASAFLLDTLQNRAYGTTFFSATLYPLPYYQQLLSQGVGETLKIRSPFPKENLKLILYPSISTRYKDRDQSIHEVVKVIETVYKQKTGNYIAFFPSYQYLNQVYDLLKEKAIDLYVQEREMPLIERDEILYLFKKDSETTKLGLFVMGGIFSEGIDYIGDMLAGVIVVGVGLPMINALNDQLKDYYEATYQKGFDYAYQNPGMNKVIQAVGRVIRTPEDRGVAVLIDDRFNTRYYHRLFPPEWNHFEVVKTPQQLVSSLTKFYKKEGATNEK